MYIAGQLILDPPTPTKYGWIRIADGRIVELGTGNAPVRRVDSGDEHTLITPGFIDAHVHLPQMDAIGHDGMELLEWLDRVIYPAEHAWSDIDFAHERCITALRRMFEAGTLSFAGYLTPHAHSVDVLHRCLQSIPLRAIAGQVLMDRNAPDELVNHTPIDPRTRHTERFQPSINPRFAIACTDELLLRATKLASGGNRTPILDDHHTDEPIFIQTHLAETVEECETVAQLFPDARDYTDVYDRVGMLTSRTLLAHGVHLDDDALRRITGQSAVIVHCPTANTFLRAGVFDLARMRAHGVRLALGSDVAAGPDIAMPRVARAMIDVAKLRSMTIDEGAFIPTPDEAWRMITRGNAEALGWSDAGRIEVGARADLLLLRPPFAIDDSVLSRLIYEWDDSFISERILAGELIRR